MGRRKVSRQELNQRQQSYLSNVVDGSQPLDEQAAEVVRDYLENFHAKQ